MSKTKAKILGYNEFYDQLRIRTKDRTITLDGDDAAEILAEAIEGKQKHGRWVENTLEFIGVTLKVYRCTACGEPFWTNPPGYCPHCGAKMDEPEAEP